MPVFVFLILITLFILVVLWLDRARRSDYSIHRNPGKSRAELRSITAPQKAEGKTREQPAHIAPTVRFGTKPASDPSPEVSTEQQTELLRFIKEGRMIDAVRLYRQMFGVGLKEAKESVDKMRSDLMASGLHLQAAPAPRIADPETEREIQDLLAQGKKIEAIKLYRMLYGCDLKEAKQVIDFWDSQRRR